LNVPGGIIATAPVIKIAFGKGGVHSLGGIIVMAPVIKVAFGIGGVLDTDVIPRVARVVVGVLNPYVHGDSVTVATSGERAYTWGWMEAAIISWIVSVVGRALRLQFV
jgi:hypothetical protein